MTQHVFNEQALLELLATRKAGLQGFLQDFNLITRTDEARLINEFRDPVHRILNRKLALFLMRVWSITRQLQGSSG